MKKWTLTPILLISSTPASSYFPSDWGFAAVGRGYGAAMPGSVVNGNGYWNTAPSTWVSDGFRPGDHSVSDSILRVSSRVESLMGATALSSSGDVAQALFRYNFGLNDYQYGATSFTCIDPLVLDLDDDGIELSHPTDGDVYFDVDADGKRQQTGWVTGGDGLLVRDKNGNGHIDDITEVFSEYYASGAEDGFAALRTLDSNHDGRFDAADAAFGQVRVWTDADRDAETDAGELTTLAELGIASLDLNATATDGEVIAGNEVRARAEYRRTDGTTRAVAAVDFATNPLGQEWSTDQTGFTASSESGVSSYTVTDAAGMRVDVAARKVNSAITNGSEWRIAA